MVKQTENHMAKQLEPEVDVEADSEREDQCSTPTSSLLRGLTHQGGRRCSFCGTGLGEVAWSHLLSTFACFDCFSEETATVPKPKRVPNPVPPPLDLTYFEVKALLSPTGYAPSRATAKRKLTQALEEAA